MGRCKEVNVAMCILGNLVDQHPDRGRLCEPKCWHSPLNPVLWGHLRGTPAPVFLRDTVGWVQYALDLLPGRLVLKWLAVL